MQQQEKKKNLHNLSINSRFYNPRPENNLSKNMSIERPKESKFPKRGMLYQQSLASIKFENTYDFGEDNIMEE